MAKTLVLPTTGAYLAVTRNARVMSPRMLALVISARVATQDTGYPYVSFVSWFRAQRQKRLFAPTLTPAEAQAEAQHFADQVHEKFDASLDEVIDATRFDKEIAQMLLIGLGLVVAGALAGAAIGGPYGAIVGAIVGLIAAVVVNVIPFEKYSFFDRWGRLVQAMLPIERYAVVGTMRESIDHAVEKAGQAKLDPWLYRDPKGFYTDWGGPDMIVARAWEYLQRADCYPSTVSAPPLSIGGPRSAVSTTDSATYAGKRAWHDEWPEEVLYALGCAFGDVGDVAIGWDLVTAPHKVLLRDTFYYRELLQGRGSQWLRAWFDPIANNMPASEAYAACAAHGMHGIGDVPWSPELRAIAQQRNADLRAKADAEAKAQKDKI